jgi:uncharacterized protein with HEPN domain
VSRDSTILLADIEASCARVVRYSRGLSQEQVLTDTMRLDAILMNLRTIGEAVKRFPAEITSRYDEIPWRRIAGLRDFIAHAYFALDLDIIWDTVQTDVPELHEGIRTILHQEELRSG